MQSDNCRYSKIWIFGHNSADSSNWANYFGIFRNPLILRYLRESPLALLFAQSAAFASVPYPPRHDLKQQGYVSLPIAGCTPDGTDIPPASRQYTQFLDREKDLSIRRSGPKRNECARLLCRLARSPQASAGSPYKASSYCLSIFIASVSKACSNPWCKDAVAEL